MIDHAGQVAALVRAYRETRDTKILEALKAYQHRTAEAQRQRSAERAELAEIAYRKVVAGKTEVTPFERRVLRRLAREALHLAPEHYRLAWLHPLRRHMIFRLIEKGLVEFEAKRIVLTKAGRFACSARED